MQPHLLSIALYSFTVTLLVAFPDDRCLLRQRHVSLDCASRYPFVNILRQCVMSNCYWHRNRFGRYTAVPVWHPLESIFTWE